MSEVSVLPTTRIDSVRALQDMLGDLHGLAVDPPSIYFAVKGIQRGNSPSIGVLYIHFSPKMHTYSINIRALGSSAFTITNQRTDSLKSIFESADILKVCFDLREACHVLHAAYGVTINGIIDLQLLELAKRTASRKYLVGLRQCIERDHPAGYVDASVPSVEYFPGLWQTYSPLLRRKSHSFWRFKVREAVKKRMRDSRSGTYRSESKYGAQEFMFDADVVDEERLQWNEQVLDGAKDELDLDAHDFWEDPNGARWHGPYPPITESSVLTLAAQL